MRFVGRRVIAMAGAVLFAAVATGCAANNGPIDLANVASAQPPLPGGVKIGAAALPAPAAPVPSCDATASLRPPPALPAPGAMPAGTTMAKIQARGYLIAGVDQNTFLFGYRNPTDNVLEGFDIDMARDVAKAIFGNPDAVQFKAITSAQRIDVLQKGEVDIVARTFTVSCARRTQVDFSSVYYLAQRRVLVQKNSPVRSVDDLGGKRVCATSGSDSLSQNQNGAKPPVPVAVDDWSDCLVMLQQGEADAVITDDTILAGMLAQDPNTKIVGPSIAPEPYGLAIRKGDTDFVRFVNGVLDGVRKDGTWVASYQRWLGGRIGGSPVPPAANYSD